jgi:hypothetical protein
MGALEPRVRLEILDSHPGQHAVDSLRYSIARMVENLMPPRPRPSERTNHPPSMSLSRLIGGGTTLLLPTGQQNPGIEGDRDLAGGGGLST